LYELAFQLRTPVYKLSEEMPYEELLGWVEYMNVRPIGWRDDDRAFKLLQAQGVKQKPWEIFSSLLPLYKSRKQPREEGWIEMSQLKTSLMFHKMLSATGGDKLDIWSKLEESKER